MAALVARAVISDGLIAEIYGDGVVWISQTRGKQHSFELTGDAPAHLLAFLSKNRGCYGNPNSTWKTCKQNRSDSHDGGTPMERC